ncbi:hypothetical protein C8R43DRAFT_598946 [Mycena crocata]|nr:hypothetical protein C8R43DRAFT_598946 [Mycena crocata]
MDIKPKLEPDCVGAETDRLARELQRALADNKRLRQDNKRLRHGLLQNLGPSAVKRKPEEFINVDDDDVSMHTLPVLVGSGVKVEIIEILDDDDASPQVTAKIEQNPCSILRAGVALKREDSRTLSGHAHMKEEAEIITILDEEDIQPSFPSVKEEIMETSDGAGQTPAVGTLKIRAPSSIPLPPSVSHAVRPTPKNVKREPSLSPVTPSVQFHGVKEEDIGISFGDNARTLLLPIPATSVTCNITPSPLANGGVSKRQRSPSPTPSPVNGVCSHQGRPASANACQSAAPNNQSISVAPKPSKRQKVAPGEQQPGEAEVTDDVLVASYLADVVPLSINPPLTQTLSLPSRVDMKHRFGGLRRGPMPMKFTNAPLADRAVQFFNYDNNPGMPIKPGDPGVFFSGSLKPMGDWERAIFVSGIKQKARPALEYMGQYLIEVVGTLTPQQFAGQSPEFQRAWADKIVSERKYRNMKARIALRTAGQAITLTSVAAEREKRPLAAVTVDDVIQVLTCGEEAISVVRMTCVSYDREFVQVLVDARREQEASGIKPPAALVGPKPKKKKKRRRRTRQGRREIGTTSARLSSPSGSEYEPDSSDSSDSEE